MSNINDLMTDMLKMETIDEIRFKSIKICSNKTIYFTFKESQKILLNKLISFSLEPICFILKIDDEYHYCPLNEDKFDEDIIKKFVENI